MSNSGIPQFFHSFQEVESRDKFDYDHSVSTTNFQSLIGEYQFTEDQKCQLFRDGRICAQDHRHGWLGLTKENKEVLIGNNCARNHFDANSSFFVEKKRLKTEYSISKSIESLSELLSDRDGFSNRVRTEIKRLKQMNQQVESVEEHLSEKISKRLKDMARTKNTHVYVKVAYEEKDEDGRTQLDWVEESVGQIKYTGIWHYRTSRGEILSGLREIERELPEVLISREVGERKLRSWVKLLSGFSQLITKLDSQLAEWEKFKALDNLAMLLLMEQDTKKRIALARNILNIQQDTDEATSGSGKRLIAQVDKKIASNVGGRKFKRI